jgi:hypothetical protein
VCGLLLATWFAWSLATYGLKNTVSSNSSIALAAQYHGSNYSKIALNLYDSIVPIWLREGFPHYDPAAGDPDTRDKAFVFYQLNLIFAMGVVGGPLAIWLWLRAIRRPRPLTWERKFWAWGVPAIVLAGIAVVGERDSHGVPHLTLLALEMLGLTLLAAQFARLPRALRLALAAGCVLDFYFGVYLQARVQGLENTADRVVYDDIWGIRESPKPGLATGAVSRDTWFFWQVKHVYELSNRLLVHIPQAYHDRPTFAMRWPLIKAELDKGIREDEQRWAGWQRLHSGVTAYIGDLAAGESGVGTDVASALLCLIFATGVVALVTKSNPSRLDFGPTPAHTAVNHRVGGKPWQRYGKPRKS